MTGLLMFEAAARSLNFTTAARELGLTQAAVSQQVRALESELGTKMFIRTKKGLRLTPAGAQLYRAVSTGFDHIAGATESIRSIGGRPPLTIGVSFAVATFWLMARLPAFRGQRPDIDVQIVASEPSIDAIPEGIDAGIVFGHGRWPGYTATLLQEAHAFPVCSPGYLERRPSITKPEQLMDETLLEVDDTRGGLLCWTEFFAELGQVFSRPIPFKYNSRSLLMQAACDGQGITIGWNIVSDDLLTSGRLVRPIDVSIVTKGSYFFVVAEGEMREEAKAFQDWLFDCFRQSRPVAKNSKVKDAYKISEGLASLRSSLPQRQQESGTLTTEAPADEGMPFLARPNSRFLT